MADQIQDIALNDTEAEMIAKQVEKTLSAARDNAEYVAILKGFVAAGIFGYAEMTSLFTAAQYLRDAADHVEGLAQRQSGGLN